MKPAIVSFTAMLIIASFGVSTFAQDTAPAPPVPPPVSPAPPAAPTPPSGEMKGESGKKMDRAARKAQRKAERQQRRAERKAERETRRAERKARKETRGKGGNGDETTGRQNRGEDDKD